MAKASLFRMTEADARTMLEGIRWPDGPVCPHCGSTSVGALMGGSCRPGLRKCKNKECRKQFTVTVGTIFESSHVKLSEWMYAFASMCASKKGISALQLKRELEVSYETAWFMCHRIRHAMKTDTPLLKGEIEVDETYVGGKPRVKGVSKRGRGTSKTPVVALVQRGGNVKTHVVADVTAKTLRQAIVEGTCMPESILFTDELPAYRKTGKQFADHQSVNHSAKEYARPDGANTNTIESFFALLKRGVYGNFHSVSKQHLHRYCTEFEFRWNTRHSSDSVRTVQALSQAEGKRLTYIQAR